MINTTLSIDSATLKKIKKLSSNSNGKKIKIILQALEACTKKHKKNKKSGTVKYQNLENMVQIHICIPEELYDVLCAIRCSAKLSVSLMFSEAIDFLLTNKIEIKGDSYHNYFYSIRFLEINSWIITTIMWKNTA